MKKKVPIKETPAKKTPARKKAPVNADVPVGIAEEAPKKSTESIPDMNGLDIAIPGADHSMTATLTSIDKSLKIISACVLQQQDPETGETLKSWLKTREFG